MRHLGTLRYQPMQQDFGILPNGALPAQANTGQPWNGAGTITNGLFVGSGLGLLLVDPGILTDGASYVLGPPNVIDTVFLYVNYIDTNNNTFCCQVDTGNWLIADTIGGVTTARATLADPGEADGDLIAAIWSGQTISVYQNGVFRMSGVSQLARGTVIGAQTGITWGIRKLASGLADVSYP